MLKAFLGFLVGIFAALFVSYVPHVEFRAFSSILTNPSSSVQGSNCEARGPFKMIRYGVERDFNFSTCDTLSDLISRARELHQDPTITRFTTLHGINVSAPTDIVGDFVALHDHEHFIWQPRYPGFKTAVPIDGRVVMVETISDKPRLFSLDNLLDDQECDQM